MHSIPSRPFTQEVLTTSYVVSVVKLQIFSLVSIDMITPQKEQIFNYLPSFGKKMSGKVFKSLERITTPVIKSKLCIFKGMAMKTFHARWTRLTGRWKIM